MWTVCLLLLLVPAATAKSGLGYAGTADVETWAPYLAEVARANGLDPREWPPANPVLPALVVPADDQAAIRPLHALAILGRGTPEHAERLLAMHDGSQFGDPTRINDDIWILRTLAELEAQDARIDARWQELTAQSGGWGWRVGAAPDVDTTGMLLAAWAVAFEAGHVGPPSADRATYSLLEEGLREGNCNSRVWALHGFLALGPVREDDWKHIDALEARGDAYALEPGGPPDLFCTLEVATLMADAPVDPLRGVPHPFSFALLAILAAACARRGPARVQGAPPRRTP